MNNGYLTTHVLDIGIGKPGFDIPIELFNDGGDLIHQVTTNSDGRTEAPLLSEADFKTGKYAISGGRHPAPGPAQISEWHDPDRFLAGVALFQSGRASRLLFTRGQNPFHPGLPPEGELYRAEAVDLGVPATSIGLTDRVTNTAQEAKAIRRLLPQDRPRVLLVTSAFHMRRAQVLFERQGLTVLPYPVDFQARAAWAGSIWRDPLQWLPNSRSLDDSSRALRELMGRLAYRSW